MRAFNWFLIPEIKATAHLLELTCAPNMHRRPLSVLLICFVRNGKGIRILLFTHRRSNSIVLFVYSLILGIILIKDEVFTFTCKPNRLESSERLVYFDGTKWEGKKRMNNT